MIAVRFNYIIILLLSLLIIIYSIFVFGNVSKVMISLDSSCDLKKYSGQKVTIYGEALNAKEGAIISGDNGVVIVKEMEKWPIGVYGKNVTILGTLSNVTWPVREDIAASPTGTFFYIKAELITFK